MAIWTGDNMCTWEHMAVGVKMVLSNGLAGMVFAGCAFFLFFPMDEILTLIQLMSVVSSVIPILKCL